jgi:transglutaminase-like putative cysteine protease
MTRLNVRHLSTYRYASPVTLGPHRMMFRPRDSHDLRLASATLAITPQPLSIRWLHDVFGNSVAIADFGDIQTTSVEFDSRLVVDTYESRGPEFPLEEFAATYPFAYPADEVPDLARSMERHWVDPEHAVDLWAKGFVSTNGPTETSKVLADMAMSIKSAFSYATRYEEGVQAPDETLRLKSGSCRDFAVLMMEGARSLGFAARFVSGYIYSLGPDGGENVGAGATHAWVQIYLPGAGWVEFDPTNGIIGTRDLIRVAVVRDPAHAVPLTGAFTGPVGSFLGLDVGVSVTRADSFAAAA